MNFKNTDPINIPLSTEINIPTDMPPKASEPRAKVHRMTRKEAADMTDAINHLAAICDELNKTLSSPFEEREKAQQIAELYQSKFQEYEDILKGKRDELSKDIEFYITNALLHIAVKELREMNGSLRYFSDSILAKMAPHMQTIIGCAGALFVGDVERAHHLARQINTATNPATSNTSAAAARKTATAKPTDWHRPTDYDDRKWGLHCFTTALTLCQ